MNSSTPNSENRFCLVRDDWFFRMQQKVGLMSAQGLGVGRRALFWSMLAWLPLVLWAGLTGHLTPSDQGESILQHYGVHVRCLLAIPLFILGESLLHGATTRLLPYFIESGLVGGDDLPRFRAIIERTRKLRDSTFPWIVMAGFIVVRTTLPLASGELHEITWATSADGASHGFGGWWFLYVTRSVFLILVFAWLWRLVLLGILFVRLARLNLRIVPTHPDGLGGLGFIEELPRAFAPVVLALSAVAAAKWGHDVVYHQQSVTELKPLIIAMTVSILAVFLAPYLAFSGRLKAAKKQGLLDYARLVGDQGRLVHRRWILNEPVANSELLNAPEIGPMADASAIFQSVQGMRTLAIGKKGLIALTVPLLIPQLVLLSLQIPIKDILLALLRALA